MRLFDKDRVELRREFESFTNLPFPDHTVDDEKAMELHVDLLEYDTHVAGLISSLSKGVDVDPDRLRFDENLANRLEAFREERPDADAFVEEHLRYLEVLHHLIEMSKDRMAKN